MSFAIIQQAYKTISKIFNLVYSDLIENDYHSKIWREGTKIILKKSDKLNYSISKTYKIITLLNCLGKVAEKIIAVRLSYTAEINDKLLNFDQMKDRKQRSAIDAVLNLVHDAQMMKSRENTLICLLLNVKEVFDHVALKQLVKILIKLKISINLINWVKCFLQNWVIDLAFDNERQIFFYFFIKYMQSMTMTLSRRCAYVRLHVPWSKSLLYIFSLINHIDSLRKQALLIKQLLSFVLSFSRLFVFFSLYSFVLNSHFLVAIQVLFKYFSIAILSILMINNINIVFMILNCAFALSCNCSAL